MNLQDLLATIVRSAQFTIEGRLAKEPQARYFESGACVVKLSIAVNKPGAKRDDGSKPDWYKAELWNEDAQGFLDSARKGDIVSVTGRITTDRWTNNQGEEVTDLVLKQVTRAEVVRSASGGAGARQAPAAAAAPAWNTNSAGSGGGFSDEEVPF